jgi:phosphopantothenate synthetase
VFALKQPRTVSVQVGAWSKKHPELASKIVVATKFGETFDTVTGETSVDLSADAAIRSVTLTDMRTVGVAMWPTLSRNVNVTVQLAPQNASSRGVVHVHMD